MRLPNRFTVPRFYKTKLPTVVNPDENALEKRADEDLVNFIKVTSELIKHFKLNAAPTEFHNSLNHLALILVNEFRPELKSAPKTATILEFAMCVIRETVPAAVLADDQHVVDAKVFKAYFFKAFTDFPPNQADSIAQGYGIKRLKRTLSESKGKSKFDVEKAVGEMFGKQLRESGLTGEEAKVQLRLLLKIFD
jgi:hypothetical protein